MLIAIMNPCPLRGIITDPEKDCFRPGNRQEIPFQNFRTTFRQNNFDLHVPGVTYPVSYDELETRKLVNTNLSAIDQNKDIVERLL